ncbi:hypothetical protein PEPS_38280 (plasmid) [Persicobacter psychrovividus]|uniref:Uncharacterized protein n=1 Tax=Persicobacter psychrovividus TaxID=387638 RepID=A0ABM7VKL4_9BACT|nr:hypothetical protein PEPS_38280 [Persicobacter psychrovividus]
MTVWTLKFNLFFGIAFFVNFRQARLQQGKKYQHLTQFHWRCFQFFMLIIITPTIQTAS